MEAKQRIRCLVCGLSVLARCGVHPTCLPEARAAAVDAADQMEVDGLDLLSLQPIQSARTPTLRHVPAAARHSWCQTLTRALAAVAHRDDEQAWREPKCILCAPLRSGRKHKRAVSAFTLDRLQRWQDGERMSLWDWPTTCRKKPEPPTPKSAGRWPRVWAGRALTRRPVLPYCRRGFARLPRRQPKRSRPLTSCCGVSGPSTWRSAHAWRYCP